MAGPSIGNWSRAQYLADSIIEVRKKSLFAVLMFVHICVCSVMERYEDLYHDNRIFATRLFLFHHFLLKKIRVLIGEV